MQSLDQFTPPTCDCPERICDWPLESLIKATPYQLQNWNSLLDAGFSRRLIGGVEHLKYGSTVVKIDGAADFYPQGIPNLIRSVADLNSQVLLLDKEYVYRGQSDAGWMVESGITRLLGKNATAKHRLPIETSMLNAFKAEGIRYIKRRPKNDWEWLAIAQHHGVPTRLLDWTCDPLVSLFFASEPASQEFDGCVFAMQMPKDRSASKDRHPFDITELSVFMPDNPPARMAAQSGLFTIEPARFAPFESVKGFCQFYVAHNRKRQIREQLAARGYTWATLFPDLDGVVRHTKELLSALLRR